MKLNKRSFAGMIILACLTLTTLGFAATPEVEEVITTKVEGIVKDLDTGKVLKNALVCIKGCKNSAMTNATGKFYLEEVPVGTCCMRITKRGYQTLQSDIEIKEGKKLSLKVNLEQVKKAEVKPVAGISAG